MMKLCILIGTTVGSYAGYMIGEWLGFGLVGSFTLSGIGSLLGVYVGWKFARSIE
ncbi:MAG: hypothetical protein RL077_6401 [Verrucomicrobiota bacterium]|jgi:hypothetical protein